ncbi:MAG: nitrilase-related carbon-nitrogen hydrolase, partial [Alphaproteobacteria bacterium]
MTDRLAIALAQTDPLVGDVEGNIRKVADWRAEAMALGADVVVFPEMVVSGYPPEDLVLKPAFLKAVETAVEKLARTTANGGPAVILGAPWRSDGKLYNASLLLEGGRIAATRFKHDLPNYGVFDEKRVFQPGQYPGPMNFRDVRLGVMICEDMWGNEVPECLLESGAEILISLNASPYEMDKTDERIAVAVERVVETGLPLIYVNQVGGQDELVFDGASFAIGGDRTLVAQLPGFVERLSLTRWRRGNAGWVCEAGERAAPPHGVEAIYQALARG